MKFDSNLAWKQASAQVSANRDVLIALAGVFFFVPGLAVSLLMPQPAPQAGMTPQQMMDMASGYYLRALPFVIPVLLLQALGTLAMLTLFTDRRRPTVGESIRRGVLGVVTYVIAQFLVGMAIAFVGLAAVSLAALSGMQAVVLVALIAVLVAVIYMGVRVSLVAPVVAVEGTRNPVSALVRSWHLTAGNAGRLVLFYLLVLVAFLVLVAIVSLLIGILIALVTSGQPALVAGEIVRALLAAVMSVYLVAVFAAVHRQLSGPSLGDQVATFK